MTNSSLSSFDEETTIDRVACYNNWTLVQHKACIPPIFIPRFVSSVERLFLKYTVYHRKMVSLYCCLNFLFCFQSPTFFIEFNSYSIVR